MCSSCSCNNARRAVSYTHLPLPFFSFTGWKGSFYGDLHAYGKQAVRFYTETKTVTSRWFDDTPLGDGPNMTIQLK